MADKFLNYTQLQAFLNKLKELFATKQYVDDAIGAAIERSY